MKKDLSKFYYEQELVALIKSGVEPDKAKKLPMNILPVAFMTKF